MKGGQKDEFLLFSTDCRNKGEKTRAEVTSSALAMMVLGAVSGATKDVLRCTKLAQRGGACPGLRARLDEHMLDMLAARWLNTGSSLV